jgi:signal transduction histidine kinase
MIRKPKIVRLERRLTRRMIQVQAVALLLFFVLVVFPLGIYPALRFIEAPPLDPGNAEIFAEAIRPAQSGGAEVEMTPKLKQLIADKPGVWFLASTEAGVSVSLGKIPVFYDELNTALWEFASVDVRPRAGSPVDALQLERHRSQIGDVMVASGGGRTIGVVSFVAGFWALFSLALLAITTIAAAIIIPRVIRRELRGLKQAAEQAELIDIDARGTQLPIENVPQEVRALVDAVNAGLTRLDKAYAQRERFLADSAHELRTPIAILQTRLETAAPFPEKPRLLMDVARLSGLADQLLDLQRIDLGETAMRPLDLTEVASTVVGDLAPLAINAGYELALRAPEQPVMVSGDEGSLTRAVANVVQNAIVHGNNRGHITVEVSVAGVLSVSDEGPGVAPADRERIFEPFYRVKPLATGAGLGLNLAASIIQRHQGRIAVTEAPGGGARFTIALPLAAGTEASQP